MGWQEAGVAAIVVGALVFLGRTFIWTPKRGTTTFVPLGSLKTKKKGKDCCH